MCKRKEDIKSIYLLARLDYASKIIGQALDDFNGIDGSVIDNMIEADVELAFGIRKLKIGLNEHGYKFDTTRTAGR